MLIMPKDICDRVAANCPRGNSSNSGDGWPGAKPQFWSLYTEADFVCPHSHLPHHMQTLQAIGSAVGAIVGGHLADLVGR
jgi:hypothetical protein